MRSIFVVLVATSYLLASSASSGAQSPAPGGQSLRGQTKVTSAAGAVKRAKRLVENLRVSTKTPAISAAVVRRGKIVFSFGTGMIDLENRVPATGKSVYNIGSVSKIFTAVAVMQLVEAHRLSLTDDIRSYVPEFPDKGQKITIWNLMTHTSGIRHYRDSDFPGTPDGENTQPVKGYLDGLRFFSKDPLFFTPGEYFFYSSYAVNLLEGAITKASGQTFEEYLSQHIWRPAGMESAGFDIPGPIVLNRARSYEAKNGELLNYPYVDLRYKFASGGMIASAEDLVRFATAMNRGLLVKPSTRGQILTAQVPTLKQFREGKAPAAMDFEQGLLWRLRRDARGRRIAYHCGSVRGSNACLVNFVDEDLVAAIITNSWECCGWRKAEELARMF